MQMEQSELDGGITKVTLTGDFDIAGAGDVDMPFAVLAGAKDKVIVDFSDVGFLASIGVRVLVKTAKPIVGRGGKLVIVNPNAAAAKVLASTGVDQLVPVVADEAAALAEFG
jgi:anti-anti-sigma factor